MCNANNAAKAKDTAGCPLGHFLRIHHTRPGAQLCGHSCEQADCRLADQQTADCQRPRADEPSEGKSTVVMAEGPGLQFLGRIAGDWTWVGLSQLQCP